MRDIVHREFCRDSESIQERLTGTVDEMCLREGRSMNAGRATHLLALFDYWRELGGGRPVWERRFAPATLPGLVGKVSYIEISDGFPPNWRMLDHQDSLVLGAGRELSGRPLRDLPIVSHATYCATEYERCRDAGAPFYHELDVQSAGVRRNYLRLMVPLCDLDGRIVKIAYAFRRLIEADGTRAKLDFNAV